MMIHMFLASVLTVIFMFFGWDAEDALFFWIMSILVRLIWWMAEELDKLTTQLDKMRK